MQGNDSDTTCSEYDEINISQHFNEQKDVYIKFDDQLYKKLTKLNQY